MQFIPENFYNTIDIILSYLKLGDKLCLALVNKSFAKYIKIKHRHRLYHLFVTACWHNDISFVLYVKMFYEKKFIRHHKQALSEVCNKNYVKLLDILLTFGDACWPRDINYSHFMFACRQGHFETVQYLSTKYIIAKEVYQNGYTDAQSIGHDKVCEYLKKLI